MAVQKHYTQEKPLVVFKWVRRDAAAPWGTGTWDLPKDGKRGAVMSIGELEPIHCHRGIHGYADVFSLMRGMTSHRLFVAELWGKVVSWPGKKVVAQHGRLCYELKLKSEKPWLLKYSSYYEINWFFWIEYGMKDTRRLCEEVRSYLGALQSVNSGYAAYEYKAHQALLPSATERSVSHVSSSDSPPR